MKNKVIILFIASALLVGTFFAMKNDGDKTPRPCPPQCLPVVNH